MLIRMLDYGALAQINSGVTTDLANSIVDWLKTASGVVIPIKNDTEPEKQNEILIGKTNRAASADITDGTTVLEDSHYCIRMTNGKLVIAATNKRGYSRAFATLKTELINNQSNIKDGTDIMNTQVTRSLDGKNILFMGNSFVYYGFCVIEGNQKSTDKGYLYQICKNNGDEVNVYDYVWGGKTLKWIYDNHLSVADPEFLKSIDFVGRPVPRSRKTKIVSRGTLSLAFSSSGVISRQYWGTFFAPWRLETKSSTLY